MHHYNSFGPDFGADSRSWIFGFRESQNLLKSLFREVSNGSTSGTMVAKGKKDMSQTKNHKIRFWNVGIQHVHLDFAQNPDFGYPSKLNIFEIHNMIQTVLYMHGKTADGCMYTTRLCCLYYSKTAKIRQTCNLINYWLPIAAADLKAFTVVRICWTGLECHGIHKCNHRPCQQYIECCTCTYDTVLNTPYATLLCSLLLLHPKFMATMEHQTKQQRHTTTRPVSSCILSLSLTLRVEYTGDAWCMPVDRKTHSLECDGKLFGWDSLELLLGKTRSRFNILILSFSNNASMSESFTVVEGSSYC
jgi:hypothetical protein